jgi:AcrR family transcriptional regulator
MPQILAAAAQVAGTKGLNDLTVAEVASVAGFSKALVFKYFHTKEELMLALLQSLFASLPAPDRLEKESCTDALLTWAKATGEAVATNDAITSVGLELMAQASRVPGMRAVVHKAYSDLVDQLRNTLAEGIAEGEFVAVDPTTMAQHLIAQMEGANLLHLMRLDSFSVVSAYVDGTAVLLRSISVAHGSLPNRLRTSRGARLRSPAASGRKSGK